MGATTTERHSMETTEQSRPPLKISGVATIEVGQRFGRLVVTVPHKGKPAADGPRYRALGNSWAVNCARWIGERIASVDCIAAGDAA